MRATNEIHVVFLQESRHHIWSKGKRHASVVFAPASNVFIGVRPQKIAQKTTVRNLNMSADYNIEVHRRVLSTLALCGGKLDRRLEHTSVGLITRRICSIEFRSGLKPPCIVKIFSSIIAAIGKQLKQSVKVFQSLILYLLLHSS